MGPHLRPPPARPPDTHAGDRTGRRADGRSIWLTPRAVGMHVTLLVVVPAFIALFWWQIQRVRQGNTLSWAYVFEWPFFTAYAVYMWWKLVHDQAAPAPEAAGGPVGTPAARAASDPGDAPADPEAAGTAGPGPGRGAEEPGAGEPGAEGNEDEELAAYNRYLAQLDASGRRKHW
ncbi:MAG TPA: hypothetical protein VHB02_06935 [Acidimicrobiales bacterium]|nr:hypothetical protein [Acidimicrobiales bacterium]